MNIYVKRIYEEKIICPSCTQYHTLLELVGDYKCPAGTEITCPKTGKPLNFVLDLLEGVQKLTKAIEILDNET